MIASKKIEEITPQGVISPMGCFSYAKSWRVENNMFELNKTGFVLLV